MPPKRQSTNAAISSPAVGPNKGWENGLVAATIEEEFWKVNISWVVVESLENVWYLSALALAVQQPLRRQFSIISWETTVQKINELGNPKGKKVKDIPLFHEVLEVAKNTLDAGEEICTELMAKLVKFQLLCTKTSDLQRTTELKGQEERPKAKAGSGLPPADGKPTKAEKGKKNAEPVAPVKDTQLRRRGEEDNSHTYIDDEPDDGPQHYVLLVGFSQPTLLSALDSIGVHVSNIIRLCCQDKDDCDRTALSSLDTDVPTVLWMPKELNYFWDHLENVLLSGGNQSRLFDVVSLVCTLEENLSPDVDNTEAMLACGAKVFDAVTSLIYDCLDWRREHLHYLSSMKLIDVPSVTSGNTQYSPESSAEVQLSANLTSVSKKKQSEDSPDFQVEAITADVDLRLYCDLLKHIPPECVSVPLILHCMLDQVVISEQGAPPEGPASREPDMPSDCNLSRHVISAATNLPRSLEEKKKLIENFGKMEDVKTRSQPVGPLLLNYHDKRAERLHHCPVLSNFDVSEIEVDMMKNGPVWNLLHSELTHSEDMSCVKNTQELIRLLSDGFMNIDHSSEHLKSTLHSLTDLNVLEHFNASVFEQVLQEASQTYQCMDTYRSPRDGSLFILCHNRISPQRDSRQSWDEALHTDVRFRNYLEHVAGRISGWSTQATGSPQASEPPQPHAALQATTEENAERYIQEESLKAFKLEQERLKQEEREKSATKGKTGKAAGKGSNRPDSAKDNKKTNKSHEQILATPQPAPIHPAKDSTHQNTSEADKAFAGYSMNGGLVHLISEKNFLYPADGGIIQVETNRFIQGMTQMKICVMKDMHHLYMNYSGTNTGSQQGSSKVKGKPSDHHGSFFAVFSNGMKLSSCRPSTEKHEQERTLPSEIPSLSNQCSHNERLLVCTPDGVTVQFIYQNTDGGTKKLLVRQSSAHLHPFNDTSELSRVMTTEGTVIKYFKNGSSQILFADGTVSSYQDSDHILHSVPDPFTRENGSSKEQKIDRKESKERIENEVEAGPGQQCGCWITTTPSGLQLRTSGETSDLQHILTYTSTDPFSQTVVTLREDGVISMQEASGSKVVEHADGTCITTSYQQTNGQVNKDTLCSMKRWVVIQHTDFPTVFMSDDEGCQVLFGDGTAIVASSTLSYQVMLPNSGVLSINEEGQVMYTSQHRTTTAQKLQPSSYVMSPSADILCHVTDHFGNLFQVNAEGKTSVTESKIKDCLKTAHVPRLFMAHGDGSGLELLSSQTLEELLLEAHADPAVAILKDVIPEFPGAQEITLLKPSRVHRGLDQMHKKEMKSLHLKCRNWDHFPSHEKKTTGSSFGTSLDRSEQPLAVSSSPSPVLSCPEVLLVRQLIQIPSDNSMQDCIQLAPKSLEDKLVDYVMGYSRKLLSTEESCGNIRPLEFRSLDEQKDASDLLQQLLMATAAVGNGNKAF